MKTAKPKNVMAKTLVQPVFRRRRVINSRKIYSRQKEKKVLT